MEKSKSRENRLWLIADDIFSALALAAMIVWFVWLVKKQSSYRYYPTYAQQNAESGINVIGAISGYALFGPLGAVVGSHIPTKPLQIQRQTTAVGSKDTTATKVATDTTNTKGSKNSK